MAAYVAKNTYFDTIQGIKIRVLPVNLELLNLAPRIKEKI